MIDYAALAKKHGGKVAEPSGSIDYAALAKKHGGAVGDQGIDPAINAANSKYTVNPNGPVGTASGRYLDRMGSNIKDLASGLGSAAWDALKSATTLEGQVSYLPRMAKGMYDGAVDYTSDAIARQLPNGAEDMTPEQAFRASVAAVPVAGGYLTNRATDIEEGKAPEALADITTDALSMLIPGSKAGRGATGAAIRLADGKIVKPITKGLKKGSALREFADEMAHDWIPGVKQYRTVMERRAAEASSKAPAVAPEPAKAVSAPSKPIPAPAPDYKLAVEAGPRGNAAKKAMREAKEAKAAKAAAAQAKKDAGKAKFEAAKEAAKPKADKPPMMTTFRFGSEKGVAGTFYGDKIRQGPGTRTVELPTQGDGVVNLEGGAFSPDNWWSGVTGDVAGAPLAAQVWDGKLVLDSDLRRMVGKPSAADIDVVDAVAALQLKRNGAEVVHILDPDRKATVSVDLRRHSIEDLESAIQSASGGSASKPPTVTVPGETGPRVVSEPSPTSRAGAGDVAREWVQKYAAADIEGRRALVKGLSGKLTYEDMRQLAAYTDDLTDAPGAPPKAVESNFRPAKLEDVRTDPKPPVEKTPAQVKFEEAKAQAVEAKPAFKGQQSAKGANKGRFKADRERAAKGWFESGKSEAYVRERLKNVFKLSDEDISDTIRAVSGKGMN